MAEPPVKLSDIKLALKKRGLNYKLKHRDISGIFGDVLTFVDTSKGTEVSGKIVRFFTEGEVYHWPSLSHENVAPLIDVLYLNDNLNVFITIDQQTRLKNFVHDEDFVHDPRCFDRKKVYAKGIFSGLSYLHGKSLCLMNLSDANIVICRISDTAIISNFSSLMNAKRTAAFKLAVPKLYRAPETEKGRFDPIEAEMWASGTLMLDMFLAHMVPWTIVDDEPARVVEIIDKLSPEVLQAANIGSVVTISDFEKFKIFLRCFFKKKPTSRITAKLASIASFFRPNTYSRADDTKKAEDDEHSPSRIVTKQIDTRSFTFYGALPHSSVAELSCGVKNWRIIPTSYSFEQSTSAKKMDYEENKNIFTLENHQNQSIMKNPYANPLVPSYAVISKSSEVNRSHDVVCKSLSSRCSAEDEEIDVEENVSVESNLSLQKKIQSYAIKQENKSTERSLFYPTNNNTFKDSEAYSNAQLHLKNREVSKVEKGEINFNCHQSKSWSCLKCKNNNNYRSSAFHSDTSCSYSNTELLPKKESEILDSKNSDLYLNRLFNEEEAKRNDSHQSENIRGTFKVCKVINERVDTSVENDEKCQKNITLPTVSRKLKVNAPESLSNVANVGFISGHCNENVINRLSLLQDCQVFLKNHPIFQTPDDFAQKQREILKQYQILLHGEKMRLLSNLRRAHTLSYPIKSGTVTTQMNKPPEILTNKRNNLPQISSSSTSPKQMNDSQDGKSKVIEQTRSNQSKNYNAQTHKDYNVQIHRNYNVQNRKNGRRHRPKRKYSYCRAIEMSGEKWKTDAVTKKPEHRHPIFVEGNKSNEKLIGEHGESKKAAQTEGIIEKKTEIYKQKQTQNDSVDLAKNAKKKSNGKTSKPRGSNKRASKKKTKEPRRSFFFSLCPGGKVETPDPSYENFRRNFFL